MKGANVPLPVVSGRLGALVRESGRLPLEAVATFLGRLGYPAERVPQVLAGAVCVVEDGLVTPAPLPKLEVVHGDALGVMSGLESESFDVVLCDPPYSSGSTKEAGKTWRPAAERMSRDRNQDEWFGGDSLSAHGMQVFLHLCAVEWFRLLKPGGAVLVFIDWRMQHHVAGAIESADLRANNVVVWDKMVPAMGWQFRNRHELVLYFSRGTPARGLRADVGNVIAHKRVRNGIHPTEKPVPLLRTLLSVVCPPGGRVLDPFCGSGSTGEAAGARGLDATGVERWIAADFVGVERERKYALAAQARLAAVMEANAMNERRG